MINPLLALPQPIRDACVLAVLPPTGTWRDWSSYAQAVYLEAPAGLKWTTGKQDGIAVTGASAARVNDHASLQLTSGTLVCGFSEPAVYHGGLDVMLDKRKDATAGYDFFLNGTNNLSFRGDVNSVISMSWLGARSLGVTWTSGSKPRGYRDGVQGAEGSAVVLVATGTEDLSLGNRRSEVAANRPLIQSATGWFAFNRVFTETEMATVHTFLMGLRTTRGPGADRRYFDRPTPPESLEGAMFDFDASNASGRKVWDRAQNWDFDLGGNVAPVPSVLGSALEGDGQTGYAFNVSTFKIFTSGLTVKARIRLLGTTGTTQAFVGASSGLYLDMFDSRTLRWFAAGLTPSSVISTGVLQYGAPHEVALVHDPAAGRIYEYLDGVKVLDIAVTGTVAITQLGIMNGNANGFRFMRGQMSRAVMYDYPQSEGQIRASWNELARRVLYYEDFSHVPDTLANVTAGGIPGTDLLVGSGEWMVTRDATRAWLECVSPGLLYVPYDLAYGRWEFEVWKAGVSQIALMFVAQEASSVLGANQLGYHVFMNANERFSIGQSTGGVSVTRTASVNGVFNSNSWVHVIVDRGTNDSFTYYQQIDKSEVLIDSSAAGTNPFVNGDVTLSKMMVFDLDSGDRLGLIRHELGVQQ